MVRHHNIDRGPQGPWYLGGGGSNKPQSMGLRGLFLASPKLEASINCIQYCIEFKVLNDSFMMNENPLSKSSIMISSIFYTHKHNFVPKKFQFLDLRLFGFELKESYQMDQRCRMLCEGHHEVLHNCNEWRTGQRPGSNGWPQWLWLTTVVICFLFFLLLIRCFLSIFVDIFPQLWRNARFLAVSAQDSK